MIVVIRTLSKSAVLYYNDDLKNNFICNIAKIKQKECFFLCDCNNLQLFTNTILNTIIVFSQKRTFQVQYPVIFFA